MSTTAEETVIYATQNIASFLNYMHLKTAIIHQTTLPKKHPEMLKCGNFILLRVLVMSTHRGITRELRNFSSVLW